MVGFYNTHIAQAMWFFLNNSSIYFGHGYGYTISEILILLTLNKEPLKLLVLKLYIVDSSYWGQIFS